MNDEAGRVKILPPGITNSKIINSKRKKNTVSLEIETSLEVVEQAFNKTFKEMSKLAKIPGFRKGKVPRLTCTLRVRKHDTKQHDFLAA